MNNDNSPSYLHFVFVFVRLFIFFLLYILFAQLFSSCDLLQTIDVYEMCGEKLKAVLRTNREIADKKNEEIFSKKRATMGDNEVVQSSASASASTSAVAGKAKIDSFPLFIL